MIDNKYEYFTDMLDDDDEQEYLQEEANPAGLERYIRTLFGHVLKFLFQSEYQSYKWILSIRESIKSLRMIVNSPNMYSKITPKVLDKQHKDAIIYIFNKDTKDSGTPPLDPNMPRQYNWDAKFVLNVNDIVEETLYCSCMTDRMKRIVREEFKEFHGYNPDFI